VTLSWLITLPCAAIVGAAALVMARLFLQA
jgi:hypothetical protein